MPRIAAVGAFLVVAGFTPWWLAAFVGVAGYAVFTLSFSSSRWPRHMPGLVSTRVTALPLKEWADPHTATKILGETCAECGHRIHRGQHAWSRSELQAYSAHYSYHPIVTWLTAGKGVGHASPPPSSGGTTIYCESCGAVVCRGLPRHDDVFPPDEGGDGPDYINVRVV